jgi:hypothetical protein
MERVVAGQDWGVSAAADGPRDTALKNGWLPRDATGLWDVNSIGRITAGGRVRLVAVLSDGHPTRKAGIALVERAARAAVSALATTDAAGAADGTDAVDGTGGDGAVSGTAGAGAGR